MGTIRTAKDYLKMNAAESGADVLIEQLARDLEYAYRAINNGFEFGSFDFSILINKAREEIDDLE